MPAKGRRGKKRVDRPPRGDRSRVKNAPQPVKLWNVTEEIEVDSGEDVQMVHEVVRQMGTFRIEVDEDEIEFLGEVPRNRNDDGIQYLGEMARNQARRVIDVEAENRDFLEVTYEGAAVQVYEDNDWRSVITGNTVSSSGRRFTRASTQGASIRNSIGRRWETEDTDSVDTEVMQWEDAIPSQSQCERPQEPPFEGIAVEAAESENVIQTVNPPEASLVIAEQLEAENGEDDSRMVQGTPNLDIANTGEAISKDIGQTQSPPYNDDIPQPSLSPTTYNEQTAAEESSHVDRRSTLGEKNEQTNSVFTRSWSLHRSYLSIARENDGVLRCETCKAKKLNPPSQERECAKDSTKIPSSSDSSPSTFQPSTSAIPKFMFPSYHEFIDMSQTEQNNAAKSLSRRLDEIFAEQKRQKEDNKAAAAAAKKRKEQISTLGTPLIDGDQRKTRLSTGAIKRSSYHCSQVAAVSPSTPHSKSRSQPKENDERTSSQSSPSRQLVETVPPDKVVSPPVTTRSIKKHSRPRRPKPCPKPDISRCPIENDVGWVHSDEWLVEKIVSSKLKFNEDGTVKALYAVKWDGWHERHNEWVATEDVGENFIKKHWETVVRDVNAKNLALSQKDVSSTEMIDIFY